MNVSGFQVAQSRPATTAAVTAFSATLLTEITHILICNTTGTAAVASIFHDDDGGTYDQTTALYYQKSVPANDTLAIKAEAPDGGLSIQSSGTIGVQSGTANALTFTLYGKTQNAALPR